MQEIHQNAVPSNRAFILNMLYVSGIFLCSSSLCHFLHPSSFIPLLYLPFHLNLSPLAYFAASSYSFVSSFYLSFFPYLPQSRPLFLYLCFSSLSLPQSLSLLVLSKYPGSHLISSRHVATSTMTNKQWRLTFPWLVAIFSTSLLPHGFLRVMYLPARKGKKKQVKGLLYVALSWQIKTFRTLSPSKFEQLTQLSRRCLYAASEGLYRKVQLKFLSDLRKEIRYP